jgi:hypothetical protein
MIHLTRAPSHAEIRFPIIDARPEVLAELAGSNTEVEILTIQPGVDFESCYPARVMTDVDGTPVRIGSLPHLKIIKGVTFGREKDRDDIARLP